MPGVSGSPHVPPWPAVGLPEVVGGPRPWRGCLTSTVESTPPVYQWSLHSPGRPGSVTRLAAALGSGAHFLAPAGVFEGQCLMLLKATQFPFMEGSRPRRSPQPSLLCTSVFCCPDFRLCSCRPRASPMASRAGQPRGCSTGCPGRLPGGQAHCSPRETHGTLKGERGSLGTTSAERSQVDTSAMWWNLTAFSGTARLGTACTCARLGGTGVWREDRAAKGSHWA